MIQSLYCVIVNWNLKQDTLALIQSLFDSGILPGRAIVIDNASTDGSVEALETHFKSYVQIIKSARNLGFTGGNNLGIEFALSKGAEWVLLLNNDTTVSPDFLEELEKVGNNHPEFAIFGPLIFYHDKPERVWYLGDRLIPWTLATYSLYREQLEPRSCPEALPVDFISGCGMLVNRKVFEAVGLLDTSLFMYGEDADFCWRARQSGFKLAAAPRARMWHKVSTSASREKEVHRYLRSRNQNRFYRVYSRGPQIPLMFAFSLLQLIRRIGSDLIQFQPHLARPLVNGWKDGWLYPHHPVRVSYGTYDL